MQDDTCLHPLGQNPHAIPGNNKAMTTEEKRFTALLSRIGLPEMCVAFSV